MRLIASVLAIALVLGTGSATAGPVVVSGLPFATETSTARRGVVVVATDATSTDSSWPVATAVYAEQALRPKLSEPEARVLAGEPPPEKATSTIRELADLRAQVKGDDAATRAILTEIARRTGARAIALVSVTDGTVEVRIWDAADNQVGATRHRRENAGWEPLLGNLRSRYAPPTPLSPLPAKEPAAPQPKSGGGFLKSPWFWGALGAALAGGVAVYALTRDDKDTTPTRVEWGNR